MPGRCEIAINGIVHQFRIQHLHRRFFYGMGGTMHTHPEFHFILISRGKCELLLPNQPPVLCPLNTLVMINPCFAHTFRTDNTGVEHSCFIASLCDAGGTPYTGTLQSLFDQKPPPEPYCLIKLDDGAAAGFLEKLRRASGLHQAGDASFSATAAITDLFLLSMRMVFAEPFSPPPELDRRKKMAEAVREIVEIDISDPNLSLAKVASQLQMHPNYLNSLFREAENLPLGEYIIRCRLQRACHMLGSGSRIKEVAGSCGFASHNYFSRLFRKRMNCTPREYQLDPARYRTRIEDTH